MVARDTPHRRVTRSTPYALSVEGETWRLIASTSGGPKGGRPPAARSWPRAARSPSSARPPSPSGGRSRCLGRPLADSSVRPRRRRGTRRASRSARRPSPRARARPAPGPRRAAAAGPPPACGPPTCAAVAWARARLRQRVGRAPPGPRPPRPRRPSSTSSQSPNCKAVSQRTVGRGNVDLAEAVAVLVAGVLAPRVAHGLVPVAPVVQPGVDVVLVRVHEGALGDRRLDHRPDRPLADVGEHAEHALPAALEQAQDGRLVLVERAPAGSTPQPPAAARPPFFATAAGWPLWPATT